MPGVRDWIRSRSKSRSRNSKEVKAEQKATEEEERKTLPLLRADSSYNKQPRPPQSSQSNAYSNPSATRASQQGLPAAAQDSLSPQGGYESFQPGEAPQRGTYPLHGNAESRPPSQHRALSKSPSRNSRTWSLRSRRRQSDGLPPGTAITTDEPAAAPVYGHRSTSSAPSYITQFSPMASQSSKGWFSLRVCPLQTT